WFGLHRRISFLCLARARRNALSAIDGSDHAKRRIKRRIERRVEAGNPRGARTTAACVALCAGPLLSSCAPRPRADRKLYRLSEADLARLRVGSRPGGFGLLDGLAHGRADSAGGGTRLRPLGAARSLYPRRSAPGCRVPDCSPRAISL